MHRRQFLRIAGGGVVLAAGAGIGAIATRSPDKALLPWREAGALYSEPRMRALSYAILAPNPHNRQPWLVELADENQVILTVDRDRMLPHTDPFNRQIVIGLGCFLEILRMAAESDGYVVSTDLFPQGQPETRLDDRPVAVATFVKSPQARPDPLFAHVLERRSLKTPYDLDREVSSKTLRAIETAVAPVTTIGSTNDPERVGRLRELTRQALAIEIDTPRTFRESVDLFRIGKSEIEANPDGISLSGPLFELLRATGQFSRELALDPTSSAFAQGRDVELAKIETAMAHVWLTTPGNTRIDQLHAGRDWVRVNLAATAAGVGTQPLSQALQEYPEMKSRYDQAQAMLAPEGGVVQMLARLGYAAPASPSPRWPLRARIKQETT